MLIQDIKHPTALLAFAEYLAGAANGMARIAGTAKQIPVRHFETEEWRGVLIERDRVTMMPEYEAEHYVDGSFEASICGFETYECGVCSEALAGVDIDRTMDEYRDMMAEQQ